jgi:predicted DsbA family dithiol-disulfide isomerase
VKLTIYGSFNCPYSYLASLRADRLAAAGAAEVEWRAVVHDATVPRAGLPVTGQLAQMFDRELAQIRGLLKPGEAYPARRPARQPDTTPAVAAYSAAPADEGDRIRRAVYDAFWAQGLDIGDPAVLASLDCPADPPAAVMDEWRENWLRLGGPGVPMLVLADGTVSRGLGALRRLADLIPAASEW